MFRLALMACLALAPVSARADVYSDSAAITANAAAMAAALMANPQSLNDAIARVAASQKQLQDYILPLAPDFWAPVPKVDPSYGDELRSALRALVVRGLIETESVAAQSGRKHKMWRRAP